MTAHFTPTEITLKELPDSTLKELVDQELTFVDSLETSWTAPLGTWTDGASVPRLALAITDGRFATEFLKAAVVHDAYCQKENADRQPPYQSRPWRAVHRMFHEACLAGGTSPLKAGIMYAGVLWGGPRWDDPDAETRQLPADLALVGLSGSKQWIEEKQPSPADIEADVGQREQQIMRVYRLQAAALMALEGRDLHTAEARLQEAEPPLAALPGDDVMSLNLRGYQHKNWAMVRPATKREELEEAERLFQRVLVVEPRDASALNGLGSVAILRHDLDEAEKRILQALELEPDYEAALHDLELVGQLRASRSSP